MRLAGSSMVLPVLSAHVRHGITVLEIQTPRVWPVAEKRVEHGYRGWYHKQLEFQSTVRVSINPFTIATSKSFDPSLALTWIAQNVTIQDPKIGPPVVNAQSAPYALFSGSRMWIQIGDFVQCVDEPMNDQCVDTRHIEFIGPHN